MYRFELTAPRRLRQILNDKNNPIRNSIMGAIQAVMTTYTVIQDLLVKADLVDPSLDLRSKLLKIAFGEDINNQAVGGEIIWEGFRFRSPQRWK